MGDKITKKQILHCSMFLLGCFGILFCYLVYIQVFQADELNANPLNRRSASLDITRGAILDCRGEQLAYSTAPGDRQYPYGAVMAPVTGYVGESLGSSGLENLLGDELSGQSRQLRNLGPAGQLLQSDRGNDIRLTVDAGVQQEAYDALEGSRGAAVMLDAATGGVIAMVSTPSVDPASVEKRWTELSQREDSPLLNRAANGLYPPGSTIKVLIADAALDEKVTDLNENFECSGRLQIGDTYIGESHGAVHGRVNLKEALTHSCNYTFGTLAMRMHGSGLEDAFKRFGFADTFTGEIQESRCHLPKFGELGDGDTAQTGIGQGELLVTPLRMAMLASAYANGGQMMVPYLVDEVISPQGLVIRKASPAKWRDATTEQRAALISSFMENVVENGTGGAAAVSGIRVTGKTGTAENSSGAEHGWFMGTAQVQGRNVAFAVIVENSGSGAVAAAVARRLILALNGR